MSNHRTFVEPTDGRTPVTADAKRCVKEISEDDKLIEQIKDVDIDAEEAAPRSSRTDRGASFVTQVSGHQIPCSSLQESPRKSVLLGHIGDTSALSQLNNPDEPSNKKVARISEGNGAKRLCYR